MESEELEFRVQQLMEPAEKVRTMLFEVINGLKPVSELEKTIKEWEEKRQILNNKGIGVLLIPLQLGTRNFKITGDPAKDLGQIKKIKPPA